MDYEPSGLACDVYRDADALLAERRKREVGNG
jgi:hypothetical protein